MAMMLVYEGGPLHGASEVPSTEELRPERMAVEIEDGTPRWLVYYELAYVIFGRQAGYHVSKRVPIGPKVEGFN